MQTFPFGVRSWSNFEYLLIKHIHFVNLFHRKLEGYYSEFNHLHNPCSQHFSFDIAYFCDLEYNS